MSQIIRKILIANRGEIAVRIARTCRSMGIATVAVFSDADSDGMHVAAADQAVRIGPAASAESYLRADKLIAAAKATGADAIHPGYGFVAENADFAEACAAAGVVFIGPSPEAIRSMGSKIEAKRLVGAAGVAIVPGYQGDDQRDETLIRESKAIGYPVLLKATAGGGGKGMRVVRADAELAPAIESARREAKKSFGDDRLLVEKYIQRPRHIEVQILGDLHGNLVHLFERECSIQRRHQKVVEEAPAAGLTDAQRAAFGQAAVTVAGAIGYANAGTVEFIMDDTGAFYFLEVNTRLQVEHPVTECITGLDLVRLQIEVAEGKPLPMKQEDLRIQGAAVECRLYAEDPHKDFLPATGGIVDWYIPDDIEGLRVDTGVGAGSEVSVHYDPMIAKVIVHAATRSEANRRMAHALRAISVHGPRTNRAFLVRLLEHDDYARGNLHTGFIAEHREALVVATDAQTLWWFGAAAAVQDMRRRRSASRILPTMARVFRTNRLTDELLSLRSGDTTRDVHFRPISDTRYTVRVGDVSGTVDVIAADETTVVLEDADGRRERVRAVWVDDTVCVQCASMHGSLTAQEVSRFPDPFGAEVGGGCTAPMTGTIIQVSVSEGESVEQGQTLVVLEAMKMEHNVTAPRDGIIESVRVSTGDLVDDGVVLVVMQEEQEA